MHSNERNATDLHRELSRLPFHFHEPFSRVRDRTLRHLAVANLRDLMTLVTASSDLTSLKRKLLKGGDPATPSGTATLLRLHPPHRALLRRLRPLRVRPATSGAPDSGDVTGGECKARERIHRSVLTCGY